MRRRCVVVVFSFFIIPTYVSDIDKLFIIETFLWFCVFSFHTRTYYTCATKLECFGGELTRSAHALTRGGGGTKNRDIFFCRIESI